MFVPNGYALIKLKLRVIAEPTVVASVSYGITGYGAGLASGLAANSRASAVAAGSLFEDTAFSDQWELYQVTATKMVSGLPQYAEVNTITQGGLDIETLPPNSACIVRKVTALGGRQGRGRFFFPCLWFDEDQVNQAGVIQAGQVSGLQSYLDEWYDHITTVVGYTIVLFHDDAGLTTPTEVDSFQAESVIATQRRRLRR